MKDALLSALITEFAKLEQVEAVALAGSNSTQTNDSLSDYDVYIYTTSDIPVATRKVITSQYCSHMELNNQFWETEDNGQLNNGTEIELIYRNIDWLAQELQRVVIDHQVNVGYSTCFWANLIHSKILFDRHEKLSSLQERYRIDYSKALSAAVIAKNLPLLHHAAPAYPKQIAKAIKRDDYISVQHRLSAYLAGYFDVLFAINFIPHPGEKRLVQLAKKWCKVLPIGFEDSMKSLTCLDGMKYDQLSSELDLATRNLITAIKESGFTENIG